MALKFYSSTLTHRCPKCNAVVKREWHDDAWGIVCVFLFIPIGLIYLIVRLIKAKKQEFNKYGEQIICCRKCQSVVATWSNAGIAGHSRIITQEKELLEMMKPIINYLYDNFNISCAKYNNDEKYSELLGLCFKNKYGEKCNVFVFNFMGNLKMQFEDDEHEPFNAKKLVTKIINKYS